MSTREKYPKILMRRSISGAHRTLNNVRKGRYYQRAKHADDLQLNFRFNGAPVKRQSIKDMFRYNENYSLHQGKCLVCGFNAPCNCKIEIKDQTGNIIKLI